MAELEVALKPLPRPKPDGKVDGERFDAGNERHVKKQRETRATAEEQLLNDWRSILELPQGRRLLKHILDLTQMQSDPFNTNAMTMAYSTGLQRVGRELVAEINRVDPKAHALILQGEPNA